MISLGLQLCLMSLAVFRLSFIQLLRMWLNRMQLGNELELNRLGCNLVEGGPLTSPGGTGLGRLEWIVELPCYCVTLYIRAPGILPTGVKLLIVLLQTAEQFIVSLSPPLAVRIRRFLVPSTVTRTVLCMWVRRPLVVRFERLRPRRQVSITLPTGIACRPTFACRVDLVVLDSERVDEHLSGTCMLRMPRGFIVL